VSATALEFVALTRRFGALRVLTGASGRVETGGVLVVRGANGCGKSTLLRCLAGLMRPDRGTIRASEAGVDLDDHARRLRVGFLSPDLAFYDELSGAENLAFVSRLRGLPAERGARLLERLDLPAGRLWHAMSSGMRQRLRWAFALLHEPGILLLDEPFQNLDADGEARARALLGERLAAGALAVVASPASIDLPAVTDELRLGG
jgi:ABC-type multidrug transport system ATPase subunit